MHKLIVLAMAYLGNTEAQAEMGRFYLDKSNRVSAMKWLSLAAKKEHPSSIFAIGYCHYLDGNIESALSHYTQAEELGDAEAPYHMGLLYFSGEGVSKDHEKAFAYYQQSADRKFPDALHTLAWCYEQGVGTEKNIPKALGLWKKASEYGVQEANDALQKYASK